MENINETITTTTEAATETEKVLTEAVTTETETTEVEAATTEVVETAPKFFSWNEDYARSKKTRFSALLRVLVMLGFIGAGIAILLFDSFVLPKDTDRNSLLMIAFILMILAAILVPRFLFEKLYRAQFISFAEHDGKLWQVAMIPRQVNSKHGHARQQRYIRETFETAQDQASVIEIIENYKARTLRGTESYRRPRVAVMESPSVELQGKKINCTYLTESGKTKNTVFFDCYPGLLEYINGEQ